MEKHSANPNNEYNKITDSNIIRNIIQDYRLKPLGNQRRAAIILLLIEIADELHLIFQVRGNTIR